MSVSTEARSTLVEGAANPIRIIQVEDLAPRCIHVLVACIRPTHGEGGKHVALK